MKKYAMVILPDGPFGGAQRRFLTLFFYLNRLKEHRLIFFVSYSLYYQIKAIWPKENLDCVIPVGKYKETISAEGYQVEKGNAKISTIKNAVKQTVSYKGYYYFKNRLYQKKLFREIDFYCKKNGVEALLGIYSGILPLYFYLSRKNRPGIIFSNMDSWFSNISLNPRKEWYRKYATFNYAHEKSDLVDFLSPFIYVGVKKMGIRIDPEKVSITPCSFIDYSNCHIGEKSTFRIAFSGRLEKDKNPEMFIESAKTLAKEFPAIEFHIMGDGRLSGKISELINDSALPNIIFHGFHPNPPEVLATTSVFVSIQTTNNYPSQSVIEAMACGNAIIATDVGDTRMFVNELNGTLIPLEINALTDTIRGYIVKPISAINKGIHAAGNIRKEFSIEKSCEYYLSLFEKAAQKANPK